MTGWIPYIKPTRYKHDSGYRTFEVGYLKTDGSNKVAEKKVLGQYSDHIYTDYRVLTGQSKPFCINMDLTLDGYIRFFCHQKSLKWDMDEFAVSSMGLVVGEYWEHEEVTDLATTDSTPPQDLSNPPKET